MKSGIYEIKCTVSNKSYVGSSNWINRRWRSHRYSLSKGAAHTKALQSAWNKYGEEAFTFMVLEYCSVEQLEEREVYWMKTKDSVTKGYNCSYEVDAPRRGTKMTPEQIESLKTNSGLRAHWDSQKKAVIAIPLSESSEGFSLVFNSVQDAGEFFGGCHSKHRVSDVINGRRPHAWKYVFKSVI